jgi:hypothetical protein
MEAEVAAVGAGEIDRGRRRREIGASLAPFFVRACPLFVVVVFSGSRRRRGDGLSSVQDFFNILAILLIIFYK